MSDRRDHLEPVTQECARHGRKRRKGTLAGVCPVCALRGALKAKPEDEASHFPMRFGNYELLEELGRGGMGVVYKARQNGGIGRVVALKRIRDGDLADASARRRFFAEAKAAAELRHPHIVPIYDVGEHDSEPYFTMELMPGGTLTEAAARFAEPRRAAELIGKLASAVQAGHAKNLLHRDLKPANIVFDGRGEPHIADFGVAKRLDEKGSTSTGAMVGTVHYMAPEQTGGHAKRDSAAADVWSLGVILYELLAGRRPFSGHTLLEVIRSIGEDEPEPLPHLVPGIDLDLVTICDTCLQKAPERRYISAEALAEELDCYLRGEPVHPRRPGHLVRVGLFCARRPAVSALFGAAVLALVALTSWALVSAREQERARRKEVLAANVFAARALAGTVLSLLREYADIVAEEASDPRLAEALARNDRDGLKALCISAHARHAVGASSIDLWFVGDGEGYAAAYSVPPQFSLTYYVSYTFRDYFRAAKAFPAGVSRPVYVSRALRSKVDDRYKFVIASPIRGAGGAFAGLLAVTIVTNRHLSPHALSDDRRIAVLTVRRDREWPADSLPDEHILLVHDGIAHGEGVVVESEALRRLTARRDAADIPLWDRLRLAPPDWVEAQEDYIDMLAEPGPDGTRGPWLAGVAPVGSTELSVIVQTRLDDATALDRTPFRVLAAWSAVGSVLLVSAGLFAALRAKAGAKRISLKSPAAS